MKFEILSEKPQKDGGLLLECEFDEEWKEAYKISKDVIKNDPALEQDNTPECR